MFCRLRRLLSGVLRFFSISLPCGVRCENVRNATFSSFVQGRLGSSLPLAEVSAGCRPNKSRPPHQGWQGTRRKWDVVGRLREWRRATPHLASTPTGTHAEAGTARSCGCDVWPLVNAYWCCKEEKEVFLLKCTGNKCSWSIHVTCVNVSKKANCNLLTMGKWHCSSCACCDHCQKKKEVHHPTLWSMLLIHDMVYSAGHVCVPIVTIYSSLTSHRMVKHRFHFSIWHRAMTSPS